MDGPVPLGEASRPLARVQGAPRQGAGDGGLVGGVRQSLAMGRHQELQEEGQEQQAPGERVVEAQDAEGAASKRSHLPNTRRCGFLNFS